MRTTFNRTHSFYPKIPHTLFNLLSRFSNFLFLFSARLAYHPTHSPCHPWGEQLGPCSAPRAVDRPTPILSCTIECTRRQSVDGRTYVGQGSASGCNPTIRYHSHRQVGVDGVMCVHTQPGTFLKKNPLLSCIGVQRLYVGQSN